MTFAIEIGERFLDPLPLFLRFMQKNKRVNGFSQTHLLLAKTYPKKKV